MRKGTSKKPASRKPTIADRGYEATLREVVDLVESARRLSARAVNTVMTRTYWLIGQRIVDDEQHGRTRAGYGEVVIERLAADLSERFGRGFSMRNLDQMRKFFLWWPIPQTASALSAGERVGGSAEPIPQTLSAESRTPPLPLPWSHYVRLLAVSSAEARAFYETEALRVSSSKHATRSEQVVP